MSTFTFWKGFADAAVGVALLVKPEIIYHSAVSKALSQVSGLRLPNAYPTAPGEVSSQHAVAIMVIAVGLGHVRAAKDRSAIPAMIVMDAFWSAFALATVFVKPHRATSSLLMTGINHLFMTGVMIWRTGLNYKQILGFEDASNEKKTV